MSLARAPRVLILFSDLDILTLLSGAFKLKNYEVFKAATFEECFSILKQEEGKIDVVVLDAKVAADHSAMTVVTIRKINPTSRFSRLPATILPRQGCWTMALTSLH